MRTITLLLSQICNLQCPYCFAGEKLQKSGHMSMFDFYKAMRFICEDGEDLLNLRLAGGEPTLHPNIDRILIAIARRPNVMLSLLTNGTFAPSLFKLFHRIGNDRLSFLINVNDRAVVGEKKYAKMCRNIEILSRDGFNVVLGINFYSLKQSYGYIIDLASRYQCRMRWSVTHPIGGSHKYVTPEMFESVATNIQSFLKECGKRRIPVYGDCSVPLCLFEGTDLLAANWGHLSTFCTNPIVVDKDLKVSLCYGANSQHLREFCNVEDLFSYFSSLEIKRNNFWLKECRTCFYKDYDQCGGGCPYHEQYANDFEQSSSQTIDFDWECHFVSRFRIYQMRSFEYMISDGSVEYLVDERGYKTFKTMEFIKDGTLNDLFSRLQKTEVLQKEDFSGVIKEFCLMGILNVWCS